MPHEHLRVSKLDAAGSGGSIVTRGNDSRPRSERSADVPLKDGVDECAMFLVMSER